MAEQEVSEEEALWRLRWQEGLEQVVEKLQQDYPDDYFRAGDVQGRYVVVGFRTGVPSGAQALLEEFSDSYHVAVRLEVDDGYSAPDRRCSKKPAKGVLMEQKGPGSWVLEQADLTG